MRAMRVRVRACVCANSQIVLGPVLHRSEGEEDGLESAVVERRVVAKVHQPRADARLANQVQGPRNVHSGNI